MGQWGNGAVNGGMNLGNVFIAPFTHCLIAPFQSVSNHSPMTEEDAPLRVNMVTLIAGVPIAAAVATFVSVALVFILRDGHIRWAAAGLASGEGAALALLLGAPAVHWAVASGKRRLIEWLGLGTIGGAVLVAVPFLGYAAGVIARGDTSTFDRAWRTLVRLTLDAIGLPELFSAGGNLVWIELLPIVAGILTAGILWASLVRPGYLTRP